MERERSPPHRGDERGERRSSCRRWRHGNGGDELHRTRINDGDGAAGGKSEETGGANVGGSEVVAAGRARKHAVPRVMLLCWGVNRKRRRPRRPGACHSGQSTIREENRRLIVAGDKLPTGREGMRKLGKAKH